MRYPAESGSNNMKQPLNRLVCAGSSGGGKTTITKLLEKRLGLPAILHSRPTAAARSLGYEKASDVPMDKMVVFQWLALMEQYKAEQNSHRFIADRSVLDFLAYYKYQTLHTQQVADYYNVVREIANKYDLILIIPPNSNGTEDNGIRHLHGVQEVHYILCELIQEMGLMSRAFLLRTDTPQERLQEVMSLLEQHGFETGDLNAARQLAPQSSGSNAAAEVSSAAKDSFYSAG